MTRLGPYTVVVPDGEFDIAELIRLRCAARGAPPEAAEEILRRYGPDLPHLAGMLQRSKNLRDAKDWALTCQVIIDLYGKRYLREALELAGLEDSLELAANKGVRP
jgi:hypothetical protein